MENLAFAQKLLQKEYWTPTPLLPANTIGARLGIDLWLKREDCTPTGSFKIRGGLVSMAQLGDSLTNEGVYVASAGNYGLAIALAGQTRGAKVSVVVPKGATPSKIERMRLCGAEVIEHGTDFDSAKDHARQLAKERGAAFWEDGIIEEMADGAATIATEILDQSDSWDCVLVPLGNGSLIKGIAKVFKQSSPHTRVIGLVPSTAPAMYHALRGEAWDEGMNAITSADGLAVRIPIVPLVEELKPLVDDVWLLEESRLIPAVRALIDLEQTLAEPSAAICVTAAVDHAAELKGKRVAAVITGAHLNPALLPDVIAAESIV